MTTDTAPHPRPEVEARIQELLKPEKLSSVSVILDAIISDLPPSVNKLYLAGKNGQRYKNPKATAFIQTLNANVLQAYPDGKPDVPDNKKLAFSLVCFYPFPKKPTRGKEPLDKLVTNDADNRLKVALDATASVCHFNDKQVYEVSAIKSRGTWGLLALHPGGYCRVTLTVIGDL